LANLSCQYKVFINLKKVGDASNLNSTVLGVWPHFLMRSPRSQHSGPQWYQMSSCVLNKKKLRLNWQLLTLNLLFERNHKTVLVISLA